MIAKIEKGNMDSKYSRCGIWVISNFLLIVNAFKATDSTVIKMRLHKVQRLMSVYIVVCVLFVYKYQIVKVEAMRNN